VRASATELNIPFINIAVTLFPVCYYIVYKIVKALKILSGARSSLMIEIVNYVNASSYSSIKVARLRNFNEQQNRPVHKEQKEACVKKHFPGSNLRHFHSYLSIKLYPWLKTNVQEAIHFYLIHFLKLGIYTMNLIIESS
jgi:hypothetical protein